MNPDSVKQPKTLEQEVIEIQSKTIESLKAENERVKEERDSYRFYLDKLITEWHAGDTGKVLNHLNHIAAKLTTKE